MNRMRWAVGATLLLAVTSVMAATGGGGGGGMPWEQGTDAFVDSITGPWAAAIALMAICVSGAVLVFGGELNAFGRSMAFIILVTSVIMGATQLLTLFTGGAVLPATTMGQASTASVDSGATLLIAGLLAVLMVLGIARKTKAPQANKRA